MAFFAALLFLSTAYLSFPGHFSGVFSYQLFLLLPLVIGLGLCWRLGRRGIPRESIFRPQRWLALSVPLCFLVFFFHNRVQLGRGLPAAPILPYVAAVALAGGLAAWLWRRRDLDSLALTLLGLAACLAFQLAALASFKLLPFSDMLFLIDAAGKALLQGQSPYLLHFSGQVSTWHTTYLPGLWLAYLPATALGLDLRWANLVFLTAFALLTWAALPGPARGRGSAMLLLFLANPWLAFRFDLYIPALLAGAALWFWAQAKGRWDLVALVFGWMLASSQLSWPLLPVWLAWTASNYGRAASLRSGLLALLAAGLLVIPFALWDGQNMLEGILLHWDGILEMNHPNLAYWTPASLAPWIQGAWVLGAAWAAGRASGLGRLYWLCSVSLGGFLLFNFHVSHYFYFYWAALLLFGLALPEPAPEGLGLR
jgi:hypothetical protein